MGLSSQSLSGFAGLDLPHGGLDVSGVAVDPDKRIAVYAGFAQADVHARLDRRHQYSPFHRVTNGDATAVNGVGCDYGLIIPILDSPSPILVRLDWTARFPLIGGRR